MCDGMTHDHVPSTVFESRKRRNTIRLTVTDGGGSFDHMFPSDGAGPRALKTALKQAKQKWPDARSIQAEFYGRVIDRDGFTVAGRDKALFTR